MTEQEKINQLRTELKIGENSGTVKNFCPEKHLQELHRKYLDKGNLYAGL